VRMNPLFQIIKDNELITSTRNIYSQSLKTDQKFKPNNINASANKTLSFAGLH
ncbi:1036_t:CDS:1, partial [Racocetra fulgida]